MRISTRGEYGVRAMFDLAMHHGQGPIPLKVIAERQGISEHYLEQLVGAMRKAGLVTSVRGAQGGYQLADEPEAVRIGDIIRTLEGPIAPMGCLDSDDGNCDQVERCATRILWQKLQESMESVLDSTTLADLCADAIRLKAKDDSFMYHI